MKLPMGFMTDVRILLSVGLGLARCSSGGRGMD